MTCWAAYVLSAFEQWSEKSSICLPETHRSNSERIKLTVLSGRRAKKNEDEENA